MPIWPYYKAKFKKLLTLILSAFRMQMNVISSFEENYTFSMMA
jgi:hypothetical protein